MAFNIDPRKRQRLIVETTLAPDHELEELIGIFGHIQASGNLEGQRAYVLRLAENERARRQNRDLN